MDGINPTLALAAVFWGLSGHPRDADQPLESHQIQDQQAQDEQPGPADLFVLDFTDDLVGDPAASTDIDDATSRRLARWGRRAWDAFQCSGFALAMGDQEAFDNAFAEGVSVSSLFLQAVEENRVRYEHLENEVPPIMRLSMEGPSDDFIVGRIYQVALEGSILAIEKESAVRAASGKIAGVSELPQTLRSEIASKLYTTAKCHGLPAQP